MWTQVPLNLVVTSPLAGHDLTCLHFKPIWSFLICFWQKLSSGTFVETDLLESWLGSAVKMVHSNSPNTSPSRIPKASKFSPGFLTRKQLLWLHWTLHQCGELRREGEQAGISTFSSTVLCFYITVKWLRKSFVLLQFPLITLKIHKRRLSCHEPE
jgi:hypothetical protein